MGSMFGKCTPRDVCEIQDHIMANNAVQLERETKFTRSEIESLLDQFWAMAYKQDVDYSPERPPHLSYNDLIKYTDTRNPIHGRIIIAFMGRSKGTDVMHQIERGWMDFPDFVRQMAIFRKDSSSQDKLAFIFRVYDPSNNESINVGDVKALLADLHGDEMTDAEREASARSFMAEFAARPGGEVSKEMFLSGCDGTALEDMSVRFK